MAIPTAAERFDDLDRALETEDYNFGHFRPRHLIEDVRRTLGAAGIGPGSLAPDFDLPTVGGGRIRLSDLRGTPILLRFGSIT